MAKTYRSIQQWDHWLMQSLGKRLLDAERQFLPNLLVDCYGKYALLIGVPQQCSLLKFSAIPSQILISPLINKNKSICHIEGEFHKLPIASASMDIVLVSHMLELIDNPQQLLMEACRVVKPEGYIIIFGLNPFSLWGIKKRIMQNENIPWSGNFISAGTVKKWLSLADFELIKHETLFFRPPFQDHDTLYQKIKFIEWIGNKLWPPCGGIYMLMAKAKVIPLTPIKLHWKQQLSGVQATLPGSSIRNSQ